MTEIIDFFSDLHYKHVMNYILLDEIDSTNRYLLNGDFSNGTAVLTFNQTAGHGRSGRAWETSAGNAMALSIQLDNIIATKLMGAQVVAGYAMVEAVAKYCDARLKWPNDLVCAGKKLGGLIIVTKFAGSKLNKVIFGVGLNIKSVPVAVQNKAVSLQDLYDKYIDPILFAENCIDTIKEYFALYAADKIDIAKLWEKYSANYKKRIKFHIDGVVCETTEVGIDKNGRLMVCDADGICRAVTEGEIGYDFGL